MQLLEYVKRQVNCSVEAADLHRHFDKYLSGLVLMLLRFDAALLLYWQLDTQLGVGVDNYWQFNVLMSLQGVCVSGAMEEAPCLISIAGCSAAVNSELVIP